MKKSAVLLISCPDRPGIVASVSGFLYKHNANILESSQHQDVELGLFLMRVEWDLNGFDLDIGKFDKYFKPIAEKFKMKWKMAESSYLPKIAVFVSREDHCLADLLYRYRSQELNCEISLIISNHQNTKSLAEFYKTPFYYIPVSTVIPADAGIQLAKRTWIPGSPKGISHFMAAQVRNDKTTRMTKEEAEKEQLLLLKKNNIDLIVLARYMQILSPKFIKQYQNNIINIHHSFLPAFIGAKPYHQAFKKGVKIIGATSHYVTATLDNGPIIEQDVIRISHRDSVLDLIQKGRDLEKLVLSRAVRWHIENRILQYANKTVIFD